MLRSGWSFGLAAVIAVAIAFSLGVWLGQHSKDYGQRRSASDNYAEQIASDGRYGALVPDAPYPNPNPARSEWREERDLQAQRDMVKWTAWMVGISVAALIVTLIGVVFVARTLRATWEIGGKQVRAYLVSEGGSFSVKDNCLTYRLKFRNAGQSPAINCRMRLTIQLTRHRMVPLRFTSLDSRIPAIGIGATEYSFHFYNVAGNPAFWTNEKSITYPEIPADVAELTRLGGKEHEEISCIVGWDDVFGGRQNQVFSYQEEDSQIGSDERGGVMRSGTLSVGKTFLYRDNVKQKGG